MTDGQTDGLQHLMWSPYGGPHSNAAVVSSARNIPNGMQLWCCIAQQLESTSIDIDSCYRL